MARKTIRAAAALAIGALAAAGAAAQTVKITPLGSHDGEFCPLDRALIFEDPDGTRLLYDAGRTVRGGKDPRLGKIDAVLLSHVHGDHLGDVHQPAANAGTCASPDFSVNVAPVSNTVAIAVAKKAQLVLGGEMPAFFGPKLKAAGGDPKQVQMLRFGGSVKVGGVEIASVPAVHSNGLDPKFLEHEHGTALKASGLTAYVGPPGGYVVRFSNGLVAYLSGDTGITAAQALAVRRHYAANRGVLNAGGTFTTAPAEAAAVVKEAAQQARRVRSHTHGEAT